MAGTWDGLGLTWIIGPGAEASVEETGSNPGNPPVLVLAGPPCQMFIRPPADLTRWPECAIFLRKLSESADELASLLETRMTTRRGHDAGHETE